jgi:16S rRNA (cytosine1402-N4)-methyltransferase
VDEVAWLLRPRREGWVIDGTVGMGGHAEAVLATSGEDVRLLGLDGDPEALTRAAARLARFGDRVTLRRANFRDAVRVAAAQGITEARSALLDLGLSSYQLDESGRGFSFQRDEPLDMRMDRSTGDTDADLIARSSERELADAIYQFGEERLSRRIARAIVEARQEAAIVTTGRLAAIVRRAQPRRGYTRIDPATRTFQALRIWVNQELDGLDRFIEAAARRLRIGARLVVIAFHSLEDRIVKHTLRALQRDGLVEVLTKKPMVPRDEEVDRNPRARSAKLRTAERAA